MIDNLKIKKKENIRLQISTYLREEILTGNLRPGTKIPSTKILAEKWGTQIANVHAALKPLVNEGLLARTPRIGTTVRSRDNKLSVIAVYMKQDLRHPASAFSRLLLSYIEEELNSKNIECRIFYENKELNSFQQIAELAERRLIQGVIVPHIDEFVYSKFKKLPIPFSCMTSAQVKNRVLHSIKSLVNSTLTAFKTMGCKKVGLLFSTRHNKNIRKGEKIEENSLVEYLKQQAALHNIEIRDEWIHTLCDNGGISLDQYDEFAFDGFNEIWKRDEKPDGLFVYTDDLITGTLLAIMQQHVRIPEELQLVFHHNAEKKVLCPVPCYFAECSIKDTAEGLVQLIVEQFSGNKIQPVKLLYKQTKHIAKVSK